MDVNFTLDKEFHIQLEGEIIFMKNVILFDLDGTLLPMDQEIFIKDYFQRLTQKIVSHGYEPKKLLDTILSGINAMIQNEGSQTNEAVFWNVMCERYGEEVIKDKYIFEEFYKNEFHEVAKSCGYHEMSDKIIKELKKKGYRVILATNPLFPAIATRSRMKWAGLKEEDFEYVTTYENSTYCKPNIKYYLQLTEKLGIAPEQCIMVGNDVADDMVTTKLGMDVFLLTDCLVNKDNVDISIYPNGGFEELVRYLKLEVN